MCREYIITKNWEKTRGGGCDIIGVMIDFVKRHKLASGLVVLDVILLLIAILAVVQHVAKNAVIEIYAVPAAATVELNGEQYGNLASYDVLPGEYHVKVSMTGMQTKEFNVSVEENGFVRVQTYLLDDKGGFGYYLDHYDDEVLLEKIADTAEARKFVTDYTKVYGIVNELPIKYSAYAEDYSDYQQYEIVRDERDDCAKVVCLKIIDNTGGNEQAALEKIRELGYEPGNYDIRYELSLNKSVRTNDG